MSAWTHSLCAACYTERVPGREPVRLRDADGETCCACGSTHRSGIYYRDDPNRFSCGGRHEETSEDQLLVEAHNSIKEEE